MFKMNWGKGIATVLIVIASGVLLGACGGGGSTASQQEIARAEKHARRAKTEKEKERRLERKLAKLERENQLAKKHEREKERLEKKAREEAHASVSPTTTPGSTPAPEPSTPSGTDCGDGVIAGPETSCGFALNTRAEYEAYVGAGSGTVEAYSEANNEWYEMYCTGSPHECSGAISATVYWP